jgi:hypothetical protein
VPASRGAGECARVELAGALAKPAQARVDVAGDRNDLDVLASGAQLRGAARASRADARAGGERVERGRPAEHVLGGGAGRCAEQGEASWQLLRDVLRGVHGEVDGALQERLLEPSHPA